VLSTRGLLTSPLLVTSSQLQCIWSPSINVESSPLIPRCIADEWFPSQIPTIVGNRPKSQCRRNKCRVSCLKPVRRAALSPPINVGVSNVRSVHANSASICDWITSKDLHLAATVETWHDSRDCPDLIACSPPGFNFIECARPRVNADDVSMLTNHGGV
jgi:hypothetical protein